MLSHAMPNSSPEATLHGLALGPRPPSACHRPSLLKHQSAPVASAQTLSVCFLQFPPAALGRNRPSQRLMSIR